MKLVKMTELARGLGVPIATFQSWVEKDPSLAVWQAGGGRYGGSWLIDVEKFEGRHGITLVDVYMLGSSRWVRATKLAEVSKISRKTIANWCRNRPNFAKRLGRNYYIDLTELGASEEELSTLLKRIKETE